MSTGRGGRDRYRRDHHPRSEEKSHHGRENPPSRHLWVGNLSHSLSESTLADHFLRFGDLESVAFQPGRSYAFVNFRDEEGAFAAIRHLQGYAVAGNPLRIEFTKAYLPKSIFDYLPPSSVKTLLRCNGKEWNMTLTGVVQRRLVKGWKQFIVNNNLKKGSVLLFELVEVT